MLSNALLVLMGALCKYCLSKYWMFKMTISSSTGSQLTEVLTENDDKEPLHPCGKFSHQIKK